MAWLTTLRSGDLGGVADSPLIASLTMAASKSRRTHLLLASIVPPRPLRSPAAYNRFPNMDVLYFLKRRTAFLRSFYKQTSAPYVETKRKIEACEEPYAWPEGYEDSEPPFLAEWQEADEALEFLGQACVAFLSATLKLFLNESETRFRETFDSLPIPALDKAVFKKQGFVEGYRQWFALMGINMEDSGADVTLMSEIVTTRNLSEHPKTISLMHLSQGDDERKKFPHPFFANPIEEAIFKQQQEETGEDVGIPWMISIQPDKMRQAIDEVDRLCDWLEPMWQKGPQKLPK